MTSLLQGVVRRCCLTSVPYSPMGQNPSSVAGGSWLTIVRTVIRNNFPKPKEVKRIRVHGWEKRMSTPGGRRIIMRRILKGRHVLTH